MRGIFVQLVRNKEPFRITGRALCVAAAMATLFAQSPPTASASGSRVTALPRTLEVKLALSAAPQHLRAGAAVNVLDPARGYEKERDGSNGFTCYVQRTDYMREDFNDGYVVPECQGPQGTDSTMRVEFDVERLRAAGKLDPAGLKAAIQAGFADGRYHAPERPGVAYMLSPLLGIYDGKSKSTTAMNMPHYMFYAPNLKKEDFGGGEIMGPNPYLVNPGPMGYMILHVGAAEKKQINEDSRALLKEACEYRSAFCMAGVTPGR